MEVLAARKDHGKEIDSGDSVFPCGQMLLFVLVTVLFFCGECRTTAPTSLCSNSRNRSSCHSSVLSLYRRQTFSVISAWRSQRLWLCGAGVIRPHGYGTDALWRRNGSVLAGCRERKVFSISDCIIRSRLWCVGPGDRSLRSALRQY
jgi:hypothetical protein